MRWVGMAVWSLAIACGPAVPLDDEGSTTTTTADDGADDTPLPTTSPPPTDESTSSANTSTGGESTGGETTSTSEGEDDGTFIDPSAPCSSDRELELTHCGSVQCDLWAQDCMKGQKCMPAEGREPKVWDRTDCVDIARSPGAPGDPCFAEGDQWSGIDDCQLSAMCWNTDPETNAGTCVGFCMGSEANPVCSDGESCFVAHDGHIILCLPTCDPLAPACDAGLACVKSNGHPNPDPFTCIPESLVVDRTAYADACDDVVGCGSGLVCVDAEHVPGCDTEKCCSLLCDPLADNGCPELFRGQYCMLLDDQPSLGHCGFD